MNWSGVQWWHYGVGLLYAIGIGHVCIAYLRSVLVSGIYGADAPRSTTPHDEHPAMIGVLERGLYFSAWVFGAPEFIAIWLGLKATGQWARWSGKSDVGQKQVEGRNVFNVFLLGNGLSIAYGVLGALITEWLSKGHWLDALFTGVLLVVGTALLVVWARIANSKESNTAPMRDRA